MYHGMVAGLAKPVLSYAAEITPLLTSVQVRHWRYNRYKKPYKFLKPVVPLENLSRDEPVTSSSNLGDMDKVRKFEWTAKSMNARGFLRFQKEYKPPVDARERMLQLSKDVIPRLTKLETEKAVLKYKITDAKTKFDLLSRAFVQFDHGVPNSMLYMMDSVGDIVHFYTTEIKTQTPFDLLTRQAEDLPPNLHILPKPIRFHPETDTQFGGMTAFPKSSTIVTGLRSKKKYRGYEAKKTWP
ncbi:uncharacterized protein LOC110843910 [Folsomia candida]|uniref:Large ribosomal subunit protein mL50 n=1 Tax=Folsomia candida TaxID=158441 RepID=A0A226EPA6_FOLCA|nr:uncharacterized protein LOC110843910 [Folsomia candida]OXA59038.1 hypothetical protein Fcan01_06279 [Folsomia candida]